MVFLLIVLVLFSLVFLGFGLFLSKKIQVQSTENDPMFSFFRYSILFITIIMMIGGGIDVFMSVTDYVAPNTYSQSYDDYKLYQVKEITQGENEVSEKEIKRMYQGYIEHEKQQMKESAMQGIIKSIGFIVIPFPFFYFFAKKKKD